MQTSPSVRRAWIEIAGVVYLIDEIHMSPSVRRAWIEIPSGWSGDLQMQTGALRTEGGDRNVTPILHNCTEDLSPSVRRAWIEIWVAVILSIKTWSPSVRRAWIEMVDLSSSESSVQVALRTEGVDRNVLVFGLCSVFSCRPPYGGRG